MLLLVVIQTHWLVDIITRTDGEAETRKDRTKPGDTGESCDLLGSPKTPVRVCVFVCLCGSLGGGNRNASPSQA